MQIQKFLPTNLCRLEAVGVFFDETNNTDCLPILAEKSPVFEGHSQQTGLPENSEKGTELDKTTAVVHCPEIQTVVCCIL